MEQKIIKYLIIISLLFGISCGRTFAQNYDIRVAVLKDASEFSLKIMGRYKVYEPKYGKVLLEGRSLRRQKIYPSKKGIHFGHFDYAKLINIVPEQDSSIYINHRRFRGNIDIIYQDNGLLLVVNSVDIEKYVKGVMYHEVSHRWPIEALKAQAIATRTYALYRKKVNTGKKYDVTSDIYSQVYGGKTSERYRTNIAVDRTKGLILTYNNEILPAYFHATCGGHTEDVSELWNEDIPPLKGVVCNFCKESPHYKWKKNIRLKDIQDKLNQNGYNLWLIEAIDVIERNKSGRIKTLRLTMRDGKTVKISGKKFRDIVGPNIIKSNNYEVQMHGYYADFIGKGWGHGVGLCQWGANFMARKRKGFEEILKYYYPGAEIVDYSGIKQ